MKPTTNEWLEIAAEDLDTAEAMYEGGRYLYACFEAQQATEKALKAVLQEAVKVPPKVHNLITLANEAGLNNKDMVSRQLIIWPCAIRKNARP